MGESEAGGQGGPLERALHVVGDRWSLLALHEIGHGAARFNEIQRRTGMPRDRSLIGPVPVAAVRPHRPVGDRGEVGLGR